MCFLGWCAFHLAAVSQKTGRNPRSHLHILTLGCRDLGPLQGRGVGLPWHLRMNPPKSPKRPGGSPSILAQSSTSHCLGGRRFFEATAQAPAVSPCDSSIRGVCHTTIIQSHLKCSPLGSNTHFGKQQIMLLARVAACPSCSLALVSTAHCC